MEDELTRREQARERAQVSARHAVYERMALISALIWALGTLALFVFTVPFIDRPQPYMLRAIVVPILPAALPWILYPWISDGVARRWAEQEYAALEHRNE